MSTITTNYILIDFIFTFLTLMQILDCGQSPSHCFLLSGDRELTTAVNAKGWRREKMKRTLTDLFCKPPKVNLSLVKHRKRAPLLQGLGWCMQCYILHSAQPIEHYGCQLGVCDSDNYILIFSRILTIMIIWWYFADCVIVLIWTTVDSWLWHSSYSVHSSDIN